MLSLSISKKIFASLAGILIGLVTLAQIPTGYYNNAQNKSGETLRAALRDIVTSGHVKLPYTSTSFDVWNAYQYTDVRPGTNIIWDMYSDKPSSSPNYTFTLYTNQCGTAGAEGDCYAREHQVPNSWWGGLDNAANPQYTDLHHLPPADQYVNNRKSAYPIGRVGTATYTSSNGSKLGPCNWPGYTGTVFEPINEYKGDFARAYLYVATRYMNVISSWVTTYTTTDAQYVFNSTGNNFKQWYIDMLVSWHLNDPVSQKELDRNDAIYYNTPQHNRNPYVDHPEYVCMVWSTGYCVSGPTISSVTQTPTAVLSSSTVNVSANVSSQTSVAAVTLEWGTSSSSLTNQIDMNLVTGSDYSTATAIPAQAAGTTIYYRIVAEDNSGNITNSTIYNYTVLKTEPTNYPASLSCGSTTTSAISLTWTDAAGGTVPDGYLIKASSVSLAAITDPVDGSAVANGSFTKNVASGLQQVSFTGLSASTTYYFKIYPYTNSGSNINYKTTVSPPAQTCSTQAASGGGGGSSCATDLIISEYLEGSSNNKYIEIYNNTGASVNLSNYALKLFANGAAITAPTSRVQLSGTLANQQAIVYKNSSATAYSGTSTANGAINFNGDDAIALFKISDSSYVDIFGQIGADPGTAWTSGSFTTLDKTLVRNSNVFSGVTTNPASGFPTLSTQWTQYNIDSVAFLGSHTMACPTCASPATPASAVSFTSVGTNSMTINWTNGDGTKRLVVMRQDDAVTASPDNGNTYNANTVFGSGDTLTAGEFVVYNSTGNSVAVSGLTAGKTYHVAIFEFNCSAGSELYLNPGVSSSAITYSLITSSVSESQFCITASTGYTTTVDFISTGTFSSNTYTAQLSDANGSFTSPVNIGTLVTNGNSGTIDCSIPANTPSGSAYKIRVVSSGPAVTGAAGSEFEIILSPTAVKPTSLSSSRDGFCSTDTGSITLTAAGGAGELLSWYSGSCNGAFVGEGNGLVIASPSATTKYFARWSYACSVSACDSVVVTVSGLPSASAGSTIASCNGTAAISMTGASASGGTNAWSGGNGLGAWTQNADPALATFTPSANEGSFLATLTVSASGTCGDLSATYSRKISWGSAGSWTGASSSEWFTASNWCGGVPLSTTNVTIPASGQVLNSPAINNSSAVCANLTVNGNLNIASGINLDVYGNWTNNGGNLQGSGGTVTFRGASKTISGTASTSFPNIKINSSASYTMSNDNSCTGLNFLSAATAGTLTHSSSALTVNGNVVIPNPTKSLTNAWNINNGSATVSGNLTIGNGTTTSTRVAKVAVTSGSLTVAGNIELVSGLYSASSVLDLTGGAATLNIAGAINRTSTGSLLPGTQSTVNYNGSNAAQTVVFGTALTYYNLQLNNTSPSGVTLSTSVTTSNVTGNISVLSGTFGNGGFSIAGNSTRTFTVGAAGAFRLTGGSAMPTGFSSISLASGSTVEFAGSSAQTIPALNYSNLVSSGTGARTLASSGTIGVSGNFVPGTNSFTVSGSSIQFNGSSQGIPSFNGATGFNNLLINQSSGNASLSGSVVVGGTLTLTSGALQLYDNDLTLTGSSAIAGSPFSAGKMIVADSSGVLKKYFTANGSYLFPIGDLQGTNEYSPVTVQFTSGSYAAGAFASARVKNQKHPSNSFLNHYLNRYWVLGNSGITNPVFTADAIYLDADIQGSAENIYAATYTGNLPWTKYNLINATAKTVSASGLTSTGSIELSGIPSAVAPSVTVANGDTSICQGDSALISVTVSGTGPFSYSWSPVTGLSGSTEASVKVSPATTTTYQVTVTDGVGASATASVTVTVKQATTGTQTLFACSHSLPLNWNGQSLSASGSYTALLTNSAGCDSLVTLSFTVNDPVTDTVSISACGTYTLPWGNTVSISGTYSHTYSGAAASGCDSILTYVLTIHQGSYQDTVASVCGSFSWRGNTYTAGGTYVYEYTNIYGCASADTLKLTVYQGTVDLFRYTSCGSYVWNGVTYNESGTYTHAYINLNGCHSVDTLELTVHQGSFNKYVQAACESYSWNGVVYTSGGTYVHNYLNIQGCASSDTLSLSISEQPVAGSLVADGSLCIGAVDTISGIQTSGGSWFSANTSAITVDNSGILTAIAAGSSTISYIVEGGVCPDDTAEINVQVNSCNAIVNLKLFIQGYYLGSGQMNPVLLNSGIGLSTFESDSIIIELRDPLSGEPVIAPVTTLLNTDGSITFQSPALSGSYYIAIRHRNAIETWSANPVAWSASVNYDFSTSASQAYGDNMAHMGGGVYALFNGDLNQDGMIESSDYLAMENDILQILFGYYHSDLTGDGVVESSDYLLMDANVLSIIFAAKPF